MSAQNVPLPKQVARSLIAADAKFFLALTLKPRLEPIRPTAVLVLMPFLSAFLYESVRFIKEENPEALPDLQSRQELLRASRMRMKILDDDHKPVDAMLRDADELVAAVKDSFMRDHRGLLGWLKRRLQDDLGVHFIHGEVVGTNHVGLQNTGVSTSVLSVLPQDDVGAYLRDAAEGFGGDAVSILDELGILQELGIDNYKVESSTGTPLSPPQYRDLKSERFYESVAREVSPGQGSVGVLLTSILSEVNAARIIVPEVAEENEIAAFKIKFVSLYHAAASLQKIMTKHKIVSKHPDTSFLQPNAAKQIGAILVANTVRSVSKRTTLRDHLVHYGLLPKPMKRIEPRLVLAPPLHGLVEAHTSGKSLTEVTVEVDRGLDLVSEGLRALLPESLTPQGTL